MSTNQPSPAAVEAAGTIADLIARAKLALHNQRIAWGDTGFLDQIEARLKDIDAARSEPSKTDEEIAEKWAVEGMISCYGFYHGGSAGSREAMLYACEKRDLPGLHHVSHERLLPLILRAITEAKAPLEADAAALREALLACNPSQLWDLARQHFSQPNKPLIDVTTKHRDKVCGLRDAALANHPAGRDLPERLRMVGNLLSAAGVQGLTHEDACAAIRAMKEDCLKYRAVLAQIHDEALAALGDKK